MTAWLNNWLTEWVNMWLDGWMKKRVILNTLFCRQKYVSWKHLPPRTCFYLRLTDQFCTDTSFFKQRLLTNLGHAEWVVKTSVETVPHVTIEACQYNCKIESKSWKSGRSIRHIIPDLLNELSTVSVGMWLYLPSLYTPYVTNCTHPVISLWSLTDIVS